MMFSSVFAKTLRDQRRGLLGWSLGTAATVAIMGAIWPSFSNMDMNALLDQYPDALKELFNVSDMSSASGYLNAELFSLMLPAIFIIFAVSRGARLVAGEEEEGTLEVLATMPVSRLRVLAEKAAALVVCVLVLGAVLYLSTMVTSVLFGLAVPPGDLANGVVAMVLMGIELGLVALAISASTGRRALTTGLSAGIAGATYLVFLVAQLVEGLKPLRVLTPFYQATANGPIAASLPLLAMAMPAVGIVALLGALLAFDRRDLST